MTTIELDPSRCMMLLQLPAFLVDAMSKDWSTGEWDCMLACAAWIEARTGIDPASPWRGRYHDVPSRTAMLREERSGMKGLAEKACALAGLEKTASPRFGDVGLIKARWNGRLYRVAAICLGGGKWWTATKGGLALSADSVVAAWRVP